MRYIGVDLAWRMSPGPDERQSAVAALDGQARLIFYERCGTDEEIIEDTDLISSVGCVMGVDAPLVVPPDKEGRRVCEGMLSDMQVRVRPGDPARFDRWYGGCRGVVFLEKLQARDRGYELVERLPASTGKAVVEVYPAGSWKRLFGDLPRSKGVPATQMRSALFRMRSLLKAGMPPRYPPVDLDILDKSERDLGALPGLALENYADALDAVMAAYTVMLWAREPALCEIVGDLEKGFIVLPKSPRAR